MSEILVIHDTDLREAEVSRRILDSLVHAYGGQPIHTSVFDPMTDKELAKIKPEQWKEQHATLHQQAESHPDCKVLCSGGLSASAWFNTDKSVKIGKTRGRMLPGPSTRFFNPTICTWSPKTVIKDREFFRDVEQDIRKLIFQDEPMKEPDLEVEVVETVKDLRSLLGQLHGATYLSCDIETTGFNPVTSDLLSIGFCGLKREDNSGYVVIIPEKYVNHREVGLFLQRYKGTMIFHNLKFDVKHLWKAFGVFPFHHLADTMLLGYVLDERPFNRYRHLGLKLMARVYFDAPEYDIAMGPWLDEYAIAEKTRKAEMYDEMLTYMARDCFYTVRLYPTLMDEVLDESPRLAEYHASHLVPASLALSKMETTGVYLDLPYLRKIKRTITKQLAEEMKEISEIVYHHTGREAFNPNSPKQVAEVLYNATDEQGLGLAMPKDAGRYAYKRAEGSVTTNADTLKVLARQCAPEMPAASKLINLILSYRVKSKIIGTYVDGLLDRVDTDHRIRGDFNLHGTATGRLSCSNPNLQNIPDASHVGFDIRKAYTATPGWVMLEADYSQLELRVAALFSQDPVLLDAYRNGADIHQEVALMLWNKPKSEITKYERYLAKCMNFGVIYGRGAKSIATGPEMDNLIEMSGRKWGEKEIDNYFAKFKVGYKVLFDWMELMKEECIVDQYVEAPLGSRRRFPCILNGDRAGVGRQIVNTPIQGFAAQMTVQAMIALDAKFDPEVQRLLFNVHDSIVCECIDDSTVIQDTGELIKETMEQDVLACGAICSFPTLAHAPFQSGEPIIFNLPFVADVGYGKNWANCKHDPLTITRNRKRRRIPA